MVLPSRVALFIAIVLVLPFAPISARAESEPNDSIASADLIGIGYSNAELNATLTSNDDVDFYSFSTNANQTYVMETFNIAGVPQSPATSLRLYNAFGTEIARDQSGTAGTGNANARIVFTFITAGTYYVKVARADFYNWTGTYSLRVLPKYDQPGAEWDGANDFEPNDTVEIANEIGIGLQNAVTRQLFDHTSFVTGNADQDYYRLIVQTGQTYVIETFNIAGVPQSPATSLRLYNASGTEIARDQSGTAGTGNANARIVFTFITAGTYYVKVARADFYNWTGTYSLRVLPKYDQPGAEWDGANDFEPNDVIPLANLINVGLTNTLTRRIFSINNFVTGDADQDYYRFEALAGQRYVIQTFDVQKDTSGIGTGLYLYNSIGTELANDSSGTNGEGNVNAQITFTFTNAGTYFVRVTERRFYDWTGTYSIRVCSEQCTQSVFLPMVIR